MGDLRRRKPSGGILLRVTRKDGRTRPQTTKTKIAGENSVAPHEFKRLGFIRRNQCQYCYLAKHAHPVTFWSLARSK
jgi:hypothetical protein